MDLSVPTLRTIRVVAERRSFTAAAAALGYTQSAVSRQVAAAERDLGVALFDRVSGGVRLTRDGSTVLRHVVVALDALEQAEHELGRPTADRRSVRVGGFAGAGVSLVPRVLARIAISAPDLDVSTREGTTPALVRALRSGTVDLAVLSARPPYRAPDQESPALVQHTVLDSRLLLAVPAGGRFAGLDRVPADRAAAEPWIATPAREDEPQLGVWPGLPGRPRVRHWVRDWTAKLQLVAAGAGVTTIAAELVAVLPPGVALVEIDGVPEERRRISVAHLPVGRTGLDRATVSDVVQAFAEVAARLPRR